MVSASFPWSSPVCISCQWGSGVSSDSLKWDRSHQHMVKIHERPLPECNLCENDFAVLEGLGWTQEERQWDWVGHLERHLAWKWKGLNARILFAQQQWNECKDCGNNFWCFQAKSFSPPGCYRSMCEELNQLHLQDQRTLCGSDKNLKVRGIFSIFNAKGAPVESCRMCVISQTVCNFTHN